MRLFLIASCLLLALTAPASAALPAALTTLLWDGVTKLATILVQAAAIGTSVLMAQEAVKKVYKTSKKTLKK